MCLILLDLCICLGRRGGLNQSMDIEFDWFTILSSFSCWKNSTFFRGFKRSEKVLKPVISSAGLIPIWQILSGGK